MDAEYIPWSGKAGDKPKSGNASVVVTPEGGQPKELFTTDLGPTWKDQVVALDAYAGKAFNQRLLHLRRADASVISDADTFAASAFDKGAKHTAHRARVRRREGLADDAADIVFTQNGGMEGVLEGHRF